MNESIENAIGFLEDQIALEKEIFKGYERKSNIAVLQKTIEGLKACQEPQTACHGCIYDDSEVDESERKAHCLTCLEPVTLRKNYSAADSKL
jgi:hypothetical protein